MKRMILLIALITFVLNVNYAQQIEEREPVYFYVTSKPVDAIEGMTRNTRVSNDEVYNSNPIHFAYKSKTKGVNIRFAHYDYNIYELSKIRPVRWDDTLEIRTEPASFLDNNNIIDLDELFDALSKEEIWEYFENLRDKKVYFIDKNPQFNQITQQTVKLIQVKPTISNRPVNPTIIL